MVLPLFTTTDTAVSPELALGLPLALVDGGLHGPPDGCGQAPVAEGQVLEYSVHDQLLPLLPQPVEVVPEVLGPLWSLEVDEVVVVLKRQKGRVVPVEDAVILGDVVAGGVAVPGLLEGELEVLVRHHFQDAAGGLLVEELGDWVGDSVGLGEESAPPVLLDELGQALDGPIDQPLDDLVLHEVALYSGLDPVVLLPGRLLSRLALPHLPEQAFLPPLGDVPEHQVEVVPVEYVLTDVDLQLLQL